MDLPQREYWLVHPTVQELVGTTAAKVLPRVIADWARVMRED